MFTVVKKAADSVKQRLHLQRDTQRTPPTTMAQPLAAPFFTDVNLYRYRKQRGVNLGSYLSCCPVS